ncbi:leucine-rich_repeat domain-containing protein [Hexamita inflata]|uniref:Leucine-rich repeat domain-containing protein n=1 Tax=Hexamita inflata TaxID=28002 RepID=A0AA86RKA8_9EUKA|nr:leucine-rich repeat domain-containing protein [Hexamita inflata]
MQPNHEIKSKEDLLSHFGSSQKLQICNLQQMKNLLKMDVPPKVWEDAQNRNLLSISQEFIQETKQFAFDDRKIEHIYLISFLTYLTELNLSGNRISDISSISKLKNLKKLDLTRNCIEDTSALQSLLNLTHLYLSKNKLTSYTLALPNLVDLSLSDNKLQDKSGLQHSPKLERLYLSGTQTTDIRTISQLFGLKQLYLSSNNNTEIAYLSNFVDLQILYLNCNKQLKNIGPLKFCTQITELRISTTSVADLWPLQFMKNLQTLNMDDTKVVDLYPLQNLYQLQYISAYDACIIDITPLSKLTQLDSLNFRNNKITNKDTLQHHNNFSEYRLHDQEVPTTDELKFYNKILSVHSSHEQIRKIQAENKISKFRESMTRQKEGIIFFYLIITQHNINNATLTIINQQYKLFCDFMAQQLVRWYKLPVLWGSIPRGFIFYYTCTQYLLLQQEVLNLLLHLYTQQVTPYINIICINIYHICSINRLYLPPVFVSYNILLYYKNQICLKQKPQIYILSVIYSV